MDGHPSLLQVLLDVVILLNYLLKRKHRWISKQRYHCIHAMPMNTVRDIKLPVYTHMRGQVTGIHVAHPGGVDCIISGKLEGTYQDS